MAGDAEWEVEEEGEVEKLESDVREMCKKISEYRQTTLTDPLPSLKPLTISAGSVFSLSFCKVGCLVTSWSDPIHMSYDCCWLKKLID